ncbi:MAG: extracellular solute-binding protein [Candidatus Eremiobacteraeota bacterium]|nr:extracellular solute-binding protein [Candidatus Eremiobacteraeota bacterium]
MHKLALARILALGTAVAFTGATHSGGPAHPVSVLYAGSLVTPMEGPIKAKLLDENVDFEGQPGGSKALAHLIAAGLRAPDVFVSVDPTLIESLGARVASATTFAATSLGIGWSPSSRYAQLFNDAAQGKRPLEQALETAGLRIGRTDPRLDPKGNYTMEAMRIWLGAPGASRILGDPENPAQIFPEEDLLARVDTGQADVGFFYRTEAIARGYRFLALPGKAALTDRITYTLAVLKDAPHPNEARSFARFILTGEGRPILERAGLRYLDSPQPLSL